MVDFFTSDMAVPACMTSFCSQAYTRSLQRFDREANENGTKFQESMTTGNDTTKIDRTTEHQQAPDTKKV